MLRFSKILFYFTVILLLLWQLPWCYNFFTAKSSKSGFVLYSSVIGDFVITGQQEGKDGKEGKIVVRRDLSGNKYTQDEVDSILPMFYCRQLMSDERFPDSINGIEVTPRLVQTENFVFKIAPTDLNTPHIGLYPLLESMSGRVELEMPKDVFRITGKGLEFVDMATNSIEPAKSALFTEALTKKGFRFPAIEIAGNPTTRKEYDEGYMLLDANRQLFHLKQMKGRPYVRAVDVPHGVELKHLFITEFKSRKTLALMTDKNHSLYVLTAPYEIKKVAIPSFDPEKEAVSIIGNLFDWTLRITSQEEENYFAVRSDDFSLIKTMKNKVVEETLAQKIGNYIFPIRISFTGNSDNFVKLRLNDGL